MNFDEYFQRRTVKKRICELYLDVYCASKTKGGIRLKDAANAYVTNNDEAEYTNGKVTFSFKKNCYWRYLLIPMLIKSLSDNTDEYRKYMTITKDTTENVLRINNTAKIALNGQSSQSLNRLLWEYKDREFNLEMSKPTMEAMIILVVYISMDETLKDEIFSYIGIDKSTGIQEVIDIIKNSIKPRVINSRVRKKPHTDSISNDYIVLGQDMDFPVKETPKAFYKRITKKSELVHLLPMKDNLDANKVYNDIKTQCESIIQNANTVPLLKYIYDDKGLIDEYRTLLKVILELKEGRITVKKHVIQELLAYVKGEIVSIASQNGMLVRTVFDDLYAMSKEASSTRSYLISDVVYSNTKTWRYITTSQQIIEAKPNNKYQFATKLHRLAILAIGRAEEYNNQDYPDINLSDELRSCIYHEHYYDEEIADNISCIHSHLEYNHYTVIYYMVSLLLCLNSKNKKKAVEKLMEMSQDYLPSKRDEQEAIINLLSSYLLEDEFIDEDFGKKVFETIFSKNIYKYSAICIKQLVNKTVYRELIVNAIKNAMEYSDDDGYAKANPYYMLSYGLMLKEKIDLNKAISQAGTYDDDQIFLTSSALQSKSWLDNLDNYDDKEKSLMLSLVGEMMKRIKTLGDNSGRYPIKLIYAFHLLSYVCGNMNALPTNIYASMLAELIISSDYHQRAINRNYTVSYKSRHISSGAFDENSVCLICGTYRLMATETAREKLKSIKHIILSPEQKKYYKVCYAKESGRFKILLCRLLLITDFFDNNSLIFEKNDLDQAEFLAYDNVDKVKFLELFDTVPSDDGQRIKRINEGIRDLL